MNSCRTAVDALRPIISQLIFIVVITNAAIYLPFGRVNYSMHVVSPDDIRQHKLDGTPIPVRTERISLDVMLYGVCGQSSKLKRIHDNKQILTEAGNHGYPRQPPGKSYGNRLQMILDTKLGYFVCGGEHSMSRDPQLATWVSTGLVVAMLLLLASIISLTCVAVHIAMVVNWMRARAEDEPNSFTTSWVFEVMSESIAWVAIFASLLYTAVTWSERLGSSSSFGMGYVVMLITSITIFCRSIGIDCASAFNKPFHQHRQDNIPSLPRIV